MSTLKLNGATNGSSILKAPDTGSTGQIFTLPASTGTLAKTSDLLSGITDNSNATAMTIGADENIGIGVVPEAWHSSGVALQVGAGGTVHAHTTDERIALISNAYEAASDGNWYRNVAGLSGKINIDNGTINFQTAPTGSADGAVSWTTYFNMTADGRGLSQFTAKFWINFNGTGTIAARDSHNISSIADNAAGRYTVNIDNNVANVNYAVATSVYDGNALPQRGTHSAMVANQAVGSFEVYTGYGSTTSSNGAAADPTMISVIGFGD